MKWLIAIGFLALATPAEAAPVFAALGSMFATVTGALGALAGSTVLQFLAKTALSIGLSALARAKAGKQRPAGIATEVTTSGGVTSQKIVMGKYATAGQWMAPPNSYGSSGGTPSAYLVYVIAMSAVPGVTLSRVILNDTYVELGAPGANWGRPVQGDLASYAWIDFKDGSQPAAHPDLIAAFGADPDRPWAADMVARGTAYLVGRFLYNRERFNGLVSITAELVGIPLYDPRQDSTAGGSGSQRWANKSTWTQTLNPVVMIYNILRGIRIYIDVGVTDVWGGECEAEDLPFANWAAAMNECDFGVPKPGGGTEPQFRAGIEIALAEDQPIDIIRELAKTCSAQLCEIGGVWKIRVGAVGMPIFTFYDDDIVVTSDEGFDPFPGLSATWNGISATYPDPESLWQQTEAPPRFNATWEAEDGGRRLMAELPLPACPFEAQVQRVMRAYIRDERRFRRQRVPLPPEAAVLEPLDAVAFTSGTYSYDAKVFEITGMVDHLMAVRQTVNMRERDPTDYEVDPGSYLPINRPPVTVTKPATQGVPGWGLTAEMIADAGGAGRRPGIRPVWSAAAALDARGIRWELRYAGKTSAHLKGEFAAVDDGTQLITAGILPNTDYEGRARFVTRRATVWSDWEPVHTHDVRLVADDIAAGTLTLGANQIAIIDDVLSAGGNLFPDFDMTQAGYWEGVSGAPYVFNAAGTQNVGRKYLNIPVDAAALTIRSKWFSVEPDTEYLLQAAAWMGGNAGAGSVSVAVQQGEIDAAGVITGLTFTTVKVTTDASFNAVTSWGRVSLTTGSTTRLMRFRIIRSAGGTGAGRAAGFRVEKKAGSDLVKSGAMKAAHVDTADFEAAGVSIFGGALKSSNYVAGVSGWRLSHAGTMEIRNLIDRSAMTANAASDRTQSTMLTQINVPVATNNVILTHSVGPVVFGSYVLRAVAFEARNVQAGDTTFDLQIRRKQYGAWGAWEVLTSWTIPGGTTVWDVYTSGSYLVGKYDDVEYRLRSTRAGVASSGIRNLYITTQNTVV